MFFGKRKNLVGLDIGSRYIKMVELREDKKGLELINFGMSELPPEAVVDGAIMDSGSIVASIQNLIGELSIKTKDVATSVSGHSVIIKKINLPIMTEEELEDSIQWEAEQYIPFDIADVNIDFQIINPNVEDQGQMEVLLVAVKKEMVDDYIIVLSEIGLSPVVMDVDSFAIENMFLINYPEEQEGVVALINIGATETNINILRNGSSVLIRDISSGGNQLTEEIQKRLNLSYQEAENVKIGKTGKPSSEVDAILRSVCNNIATEIERSIDFFHTTFSEESIVKIYMSGGTSKIPFLGETISQKTNIPTELINPFRSLIVDERKFDNEYLQEVAPFAAVGLGLALRRSDER